jgi:hypothetical protein
VPEPEVVHRRPLPPRPDPASQLIQAIEGRDGSRTRRLVEVWVHRRGLPSLYTLCATTLQVSLDPEALLWLECQEWFPWPVGTEAFSPTAVLEQALAPYANGVADPEPEPELLPEPQPEATEVPLPLVAVEDGVAAEEAPPLPPPPDSLLKTAPARALRLVSRARVLLRDCLDEVWDGLAGASTRAARPEAVAPPLPEEVALPSDGLPAAPVTIPALTPAPSASVALERLRPRPRLTVPRLPRASRPAPAPPDLADLRMWLPDPIEDLPRAC